jgi:transposase
MITENIFNREILPDLLKSKRGYECSYKVFNYFQAIVYRLKTGCQWRQLPLKEFFSGEVPVWQSVYYHYWKWCKASCFETLWKKFILKVKDYFDMEMINIDGSHTPAKRGGEEVGYQNRKKCKTTNMLFLADKNGNLISCSEPIAGNHHDSYNLIDNFEKMKKFPLIRDAKSPVMNADSGFDVNSFFDYCLGNDVLLNIKGNSRNSKKPKNLEAKMIFPEDYARRFVIERAFAWLDGFKLLLVRYEVKSRHWLQLHFLAFLIIMLRKTKYV